MPTEDQYLNCIRCGLCLSACPLYREDLSETATPRGHVALARKLLDGDIKSTPNFFEQMYRCFGCLACDEICPVGIKPSELAMEMRHLQEQIAPKRWKKLLFKGIIFKPGRLEKLTLPLRLYQGLGIRKLYYWLGISWLMPPFLRDLEAMLPTLPRRPLRRVLPEVTEADGEARYKVGFFLGCAQSLMFGKESAATVRVLAANGCTVITPKEVKCCGMPAIGYGRKPDPNDMDWALFDLSKDPGEHHNLKKQAPVVFQRMLEQWTQWNKQQSDPRWPFGPSGQMGQWQQ